ncbi:hypothetical protein E5675_21010 [Sphingopyxis sp. PAMC25046]|uniref:hypothetical protein n=1 Tax=Sphingopyxis sp. PAMC25046 TaxID=2565556 RepID=UPI00109DA542|nr:hypothetical protein [Sphingopyxis sp. PAMC25046]QCB56674.1 hypothetical protein E5675_21010 [Sphingopyxis sp. PAMC25046]
MMTLATACMEERHREWGLAMRAELEEAIDAGKPIRFASGCLVAALRRMPVHPEGRFSLTAHAFALGLLIPVAALQIGCAVFGFPHSLARGGMLTSGQNALLAGTYHALIPLLAVLMLLLAIGHLAMAWMLLDRDWSRLLKTGALTLSTTIAIVTFMAVLNLDTAQAALQGALLLVELAVLAGLASWHTDLPQTRGADRTTR